MAQVRRVSRACQRKCQVPKGWSISAGAVVATVRSPDSGSGRRRPSRISRSWVMPRRPLHLVLAGHVELLHVVHRDQAVAGLTPVASAR